MINKRGQLTIFVIIAILIVGMILLFFIIREGILQNPLAVESKEVYNFVQNCIEQEGIEIIYDIGRNGGYSFPSEFSTGLGTPFYYHDGKNYMPSEEQVENEISLYLDKILFFCTKNFVDFIDLNIDQREVKTKTEIRDEEVILNVNYPISISKGNNTALLKDFQVKIPVRLGIVYDSVAKIIQDQIDEESICLSCLLDISLENDLYVDMMDYNKEITIFIFRDENSKINDETFVWAFANKYKIE